MRRLTHLAGCRSGTAAVEMALSLPILLALIFGSAEIGHYFMDEHVLVKAVRDGARYAARQDFSNFSGCSGAPGGTVQADTRNLVKTGQVSGGTDKLPNWDATTTITVSVSCSTTAGSTTLAGIYTNNKNSTGTLIGAPVVTVSARVPYTPVLAAFGFRGVGYNLYASEQAAVTGI